MIKPEDIKPLTDEQEREAAKIEQDLDAKLDRERGDTHYCAGDATRDRDLRVLRVVARRYERQGWAAQIIRTAKGHLHLAVAHPEIQPLRTRPRAKDR